MSHWIGGLCLSALLGPGVTGARHAVRLIPPQYVPPFVKTNKNDATDAEAICEALMRPTMRFAAVKSAEQQSVLMLHRARDLDPADESGDVLR